MTPPSPRPPALPLARLAVLAVAAASAGCGGGVSRFPLKDPIWVDDDLRPTSVACRPDPEEPGEELCRPEEYVSPFLWDVADKTVFRPLVMFFAADPGGEARNVNALDEVPDSSWFSNRIGLRPMTRGEVRQGSCGTRPIDPAGSAPGTWVVDMGKPNGANPGFRVNIEGVGKFMLKADPHGEGERATGATSIASRLYHAAGWYAACDTVVYFDPKLLSLKPGLRFADNSGIERDFDQAALDKVLSGAPKRDGKVRMVASSWLPGRTIGPFRYEDVRADDPNDVIPHEDRRDLRGARVIAAWLGHYDSREQNSMTTWMSLDPKRKDASPGHTIHWYIDLGDCFGSKWEWEGMSRKLNHSFYFDTDDVVADLVTLGIPERAWDRAKVTPGQEMFNYFSAEGFVPDEWKGGYPNPAFARMTEADGAWATRILTRFSDDLIEEAIAVGDYTETRHRTHLRQVLSQRRDAIRRRWFSRLSPVGDVTVEGDLLCAVDLARQAGTWPATSFRYDAALWSGVDLERRTALTPSTGDGGRVCLPLPRVAPDGAFADEDPRRYAVIDLGNGVAPGPLRAHLYDLGPRRGFRLVGLERPDGPSAP